jgi:DNA-binding GntR family transcriptional regulator
MTVMESAEFAAEQIRQAIITGKFKPGDRLIEQQLTDLINVSRHPVREALRLLSREGFVELRRNRGALVSAVDPASVVEVYNIRMALGRIALNYLLAEDKLQPSDLKRLEKLATNALRLADQDSQAATINNDLEFQQAIVEATGLQRTIRYFVELTGDVRRFNNLLKIRYTDRKGDAQNYVMRLFEALRDKDLSLAESIWQAKFEKAKERYLRLLANQAPEGASR